MSDRKVTFLGQWADRYDRQVVEAEKDLDAIVEEANYSVTSMLLASAITATMRVSQSFADTLRVGQGIQKGGVGYVQDALRVLNVVGVAGAFIGRAPQLLMASQAGGTSVCAWVSTVNALRQTGQRFFVSIEGLMAEAGTAEDAINAARGTNISGLRNLLRTLNAAGVPASELTPATTDLAEVATAVKANPNAVLTVGISYVQDGVRVGHRLRAVYDAAGPVFVDTNNAVYRGIEALRAVYPSVALNGGSPMVVIPNAAITLNDVVQGAQAAGAAAVVVEVVPVVRKSNTPRRSSHGRSSPARGRHTAHGSKSPHPLGK